jgi:hypothetical protein
MTFTFCKTFIVLILNMHYISTFNLNCKYIQYAFQDDNVSISSNASRGSRHCRLCRQPGHDKRNCPLKEGSNADSGVQNSRRTRASIAKSPAAPLQSDVSLTEKSKI